MTAQDALVKLGTETAAAVSQVLLSFVGDEVETSRVSVVPPGTHPLGAYPFPAAVTKVSYVDGVTGGNAFAITARGARLLAAAMMGAPPDDDGHDLTELELSAVGEAGNQMLAAAASATAEVLGQEVEIDPPETALYDSLEEAAAVFGAAPYVTSCSLTVQGEPCRLVQLVPEAFIARMRIAFQERDAVTSLEEAQLLGASGAEGGVCEDFIRAARLRLSAELGRTRLPIRRAAALPYGAVVPLDRGAGDPLDIFVNGSHFATGRLMLVDESDWAVRIESLTPANASE